MIFATEKTEDDIKQAHLRQGYGEAKSSVAKGYGVTKPAYAQGYGEAKEHWNVTHTIMTVELIIVAILAMWFTTSGGINVIDNIVRDFLFIK
jgi:hypothetical protein